MVDISFVHLYLSMVDRSRVAEAVVARLPSPPAVADDDDIPKPNINSIILNLKTYTPSSVSVSVPRSFVRSQSVVASQ